MTDQSSNPEETTAPFNNVDSNGIPILNDVVEERDEETEQQLREMECITSASADSDSTTNESTGQSTELDHLKETLRQELHDELNELIQATLLNAAEEISSQVGKIIENKLSDALQKQMGEMLKSALEERFKNNNSF
ncbi:hypothetical protein ACFL3U_02385 [Pseudomonadota bacterium]